MEGGWREDGGQRSKKGEGGGEWREGWEGGVGGNRIATKGEGERGMGGTESGGKTVRTTTRRMARETRIGDSLLRVGSFAGEGGV